MYFLRLLIAYESYKVNAVSKLKKIVRFLLPSFFWFLVLPFPFERISTSYGAICSLPCNSVSTSQYTAWSWLGGYHIMVTEFNFGGGYSAEINDGLYHYASHWYFLILVICSLVLGMGTYAIITKLMHPQQKSK